MTSYATEDLDGFFFMVKVERFDSSASTLYVKRNHNYQVKQFQV
jgi:hypothetical protein